MTDDIEVKDLGVPRPKGLSRRQGSFTRGGVRVELSLSASQPAVA